MLREEIRTLGRKLRARNLTFYSSVRIQCRAPVPTQLIIVEEVYTYYDIYNLRFSIQVLSSTCKTPISVFYTDADNFRCDFFLGGLIIFSIRSKIAVQIRPWPIVFHLPYSSAYKITQVELYIKF